MPRLAFALVVAATAARAQQPAQPVYQIHRDVIRGRVTTDSGVAIVAADVAVTMAPDRTTQFAKSDSAGRYEIVFEKGTGDYLVHIASIGRQAFRQRAVRSGSDSVFTVNAALKASVQQLAPVQVQARRTRPGRDQGDGRAIGVGAAEMAPTGVNGLISPDQAGNLDAIASALPGVTTLATGGISVMGLPPSQNQTTLNGMAYAGGDIPRGARTATRVAASTYDPSRGGFSGAQTQVMLAPGNITVSRRAFLTLDAPQLQVADAVARRAGQKYTSLDFNAGTDGGTNMDRWMYNLGGEYRRRLSDATSLLEADIDLLQHSGVARDSVARLITTLGALGIPISSGVVPSSRVTDYAALLGRLDRPLFDYSTFTPLNTTWGLTGYANMTRRGALNLSPTSTPSHGGESRQINAGGQWLYSAYFGRLKDQLTEVRSGVSFSRSDNTPYLRLPDGRLLLTSNFSDGSAGVSSLSFAGNSGLQSTAQTITWQTTSETQFFWRGLATHRGKTFAESRLDGFSQDPAANRLGSYSFNSIADLQANKPASFTRTLSTPSRSGGEWSGVVGASDQWAPTNRFSLLYGARLEANRFTSAPAYNPQIEATFGARTNQAPNTWHLSPRVGFNWLLTQRSQTANSSMTFMPLGQFYNLPRGVFRGGIGEFRQLLEPALLADASVSTGLPTAVRRITCVGSAIPAPDWRAFATNETSIPNDCVGGVSSGFADAAPAVQVFDKTYQPSRAWRGNLSWGSQFKSISYTVDAAYSLNLNQPSTLDLNFAGMPRFTIAGEDNRPVFVPPSAIVPSTGAISVTSSRRSATYGPVIDRVSDLRGWARQLSLRVRPGTIGYTHGILLDGTYTFAQARSQSRGFDGAAFGNPNDVVWARGDYTPTHELILQTGYFSNWLAITAAGKVTSGLPYTPIVGSDVNGDGLANDRAFVFSRGAGVDPALGEAMDKLIASTSGPARNCLIKQRGSVTGRNSCQGPWTTNLNATLSPGRRLTQALHISNRVNAQMTLTNPLGGLDQLLHGDNLHGWGTPAFPDRVLYYVRGYDTLSQRFKYEINPRFGDTRPLATTLRVPFRMTVDVRVDLSRNGEEQQIERILKPGRGGNGGVKLDSTAILKRYCGNLPNWYNDLLREVDSLLLTRDQVEAIRTAQADYSARITAHWAKWSADLASLPDNFDAADLLKRQNKLILDAWEIARQEARTVLPRILTPVQLRLLPSWANTLYRAENPITGMRYFSTGAC